MTAPLSERVRRALQSDVLGWEYVGIVSEEDDVLVAEVAGLEAERDEAVENCRGFERRAHTAEAENTRLRNEVIYLKELNNGLNYSCDGAEARLAVLQNRLAAARGFCDEFCAMQCEEGPEWGECEECGCALFKIKAALGEEKKK